MLTCDIDDMTGEYLAGAAAALRDLGALDVTLMPVLMKKGRPGTRFEVLATVADADRLADAVLSHTTSLGVRRSVAERVILAREVRTIEVFGQSVAVKVATLPDGTVRAKPEFDDVSRVAAGSNRSHAEVDAEARRIAG